MSVYDFTCTTMQGKEVSLSQYKGKVILIVNTASKCGFTPQFAGLEKLYKEYKDKGLEILGFPSNQFNEQDPGTNEEIQEFCKVNYGVTFQMFKKGDVRGDNPQPLFAYLTKEKGFKGFNMDHPIAPKLVPMLKEKHPEILEGDGLKWNFTKFLIDREGNVVERFEPTTTPEEIAPAIEKLL